MDKSLFERLGKTEGITTIVDDIFDVHMTNPAVSARFLPYKDEPERFAVIKQHAVDFFSAGSGGPATYTGRDMPEAHKGLNISPAEYMSAMDDIFIVLNNHSIDEKTQNEVLAILWSLKEMIINDK